MNIPVWLANRLVGAAVTEAADGPPRAVGAAREIARAGSGIAVAADSAAVSLRFLSDAIVELAVGGPDDERLPSFARLAAPLCLPPGPIELEEGDEECRLRSRALELRLRRAGLQLEVCDRQGASLLRDDERFGLAHTPRGWRVHWALEPEDRFYGLGARTGGLDRRGRRVGVWSRDALVGEATDPLYSAIPFFVIARRGRWLGVLLDSPGHSVFDFGHTVADRLSFGPCRGALSVLLFTGPTLSQVLEQYTAVTGRAPLPPRWSLGHHQSRYSYDDESEVREIAAEFRQRGIPTDAIHLDIHYMRGFRVFTFDRSRFPAPAALSADLARDGFRLVAIVDPGVKRDKRYDVYREGIEHGYFARAGGAPFYMKVWPGDAAFPDFYRAEVRRWWGDWHRVYREAGIAGIWNDMNEPAGWKHAWYVGDGVIPLGEQDPGRATHQLEDGRSVPHAAVRNAYGHLENQATYEGLLRLRPDERPFVLTRSAFAGTQRWAAQWTGDVCSTWSALRQSLPMMLGLGLSGQGFVGSDIGGFLSDSTPELYARWIQIGALAPFCRSHTSLHSHRQEPWSFGPRVEAIARAALQQRYQLLPYLYTAFRDTARTGMPLWRPLFAEFPDDADVVAVEDQVMVGPALMAAPVFEPGASSRRVVLPRGSWFDWYSGQSLEGGQALTVDAPLERMPLFVRADVAIPTQPEVRFADDRPEQPLIWEVFLTGAARGEIGLVYEDDGRSFAYQRGQSSVTRVWCDGEALRFRSGEGLYASPRSGALVRLHGAAVGDDGLLQIPHGVAEHVLPLRWA